MCLHQIHVLVSSSPCPLRLPTRTRSETALQVPQTRQGFHGCVIIALDAALRQNLHEPSLVDPVHEVADPDPQGVWLPRRTAASCWHHVRHRIGGSGRAAPVIAPVVMEKAAYKTKSHVYGIRISHMLVTLT